MRLEPAVPFGGVVGPTRNVVPDSEVKGRANLSTGRFEIHLANPLFSALEVDHSYERGSLEVHGNVVIIKTRCEAQAELEFLLSSVFMLFPAVLSVYLPDVPFAKIAWGKLNSRACKVEYDSLDVIASVKVTSREHQEDLVIRSWAQTLSAMGDGRLSAACQYFHTGCRLLQVGQNRFEFVAEAILNFAKALQSACGDRRDDIRSSLRRLGYKSGDVDGRFMPAMVLRDQFDVAHIALSSLSSDQLRILNDYVDIAEKAFRELLEKVLTEYAAGRYDPPASSYGEVSKDKAKVLRRLARSIKPFVPR